MGCRTFATALVLLALGVQAGSFTSPEGLQVTWNVTSTTLSATITMPSSLSSQYDYWGIGFKPSGSSQSMASALLWTITKSGVFYDTWSAAKDPNLSSKKGAATLVSHVPVAGVYTSIITRSLAGSASSDITFTDGGSYLLMYALGSMTGSTPNQHSKTGGSTITLSNEFVVNDSSTSATPAVLVGAASLGLLFLAIH